MPTLKLTDNFNLTVETPPGIGSLFSKYLKSPSSVLAVLHSTTPIKDVAIGEDPLDSFALGISFDQPVQFGSSGVELGITPQMRGAISIEKNALFDAESDPFRESIPVPDKHAYLGIALEMKLAADLCRQAGTLQFGFDANTSVITTNYRLYTLADRLIPAIELGFQQFVMPADVEDINQLEENGVVTIEGSGSLTLSAEADLVSSVNPLAAPNTGILPIKVVEGASLTLGATYTLTGEYQLRIERLAGKGFRLGYEKKRNSELNVSVNADIGVSVQAGGFELIKKVLQAVSRDPVADKDTFQRAGLTDEQICTISTAIKSGLERSLAISLTGELDALYSSSTAFSYEIDAGLLDVTGIKAVHDALNGNLTGIERPGLAGIALSKSVFAAMKERKTSCKLNLLGIFTYGSVSTLFQNGTIIVDRDTGDITVTDQIGAERIQFTADNFAKDSAKLHQVLAESLLITAAYRCSGALNSSLEFNSRYWFFELYQKTSVQQMWDFLNIAQVLKLLTANEAKERLQALAVSEVSGRSTFYLQVSYTDALCRRMFLDGNKQPRSQEEYETIGRKALLLLIPSDDTISAARRFPLVDNAIWDAMKDCGQPGFPLLFQARGFNSNQIADIISDFTLILWWANSMNRMGQAVAAVLAFIAINPAFDPQNTAFQKLRSNLDHAMASVVGNSKIQFSEPWGIAALDLSSDQGGDLTLQLVSSRLAITATRGATNLTTGVRP